MKTYLLLDCNYLVWRAHYSTGHLSHKGTPTGSIFGFFKTINELQNRFATTRLVFCFDHGRSKRYKLSKKYKSNRELTEEKIEVHKQINALKFKYLKKVGYKNICYAKGYEADDIIASIAKNIKYPHHAIIVSADKDLMQLLDYDQRIQVYNPSSKKLYTHSMFMQEFGISPNRWAEVKAMAGCSSDNIEGIPGVGEKTAIKELTVGTTGKVKDKIKKYNSNEKWKKKQIKLVTIPYKGCPVFKLKKDVLDPQACAKLLDNLGFQSLKDTFHATERK